MNNTYFDQIYCICMPDRVRQRNLFLEQIHQLFPDVEPIIFPAISTRHLNNHHIGCALSHRAVIADAKINNYKNILVFEEDAILHKSFDIILSNCVKELENIKWDVLYLGAHVWENNFEKFQGCIFSEKVHSSTCMHGMAYNNSNGIFDYLLANIPSTIEDMIPWCNKYAAIDQWFMYYIQSPKYGKNDRLFNAIITSPRICSQPCLIIGGNKPDKLTDFFNINIHNNT